MKYRLRSSWQHQDQKNRRAMIFVAALYVAVLALGIYGGMACGDLCGCRTWCGLAVEALR